jgi:hypothetical protein
MKNRNGSSRVQIHEDHNEEQLVAGFRDKAVGSHKALGRAQCKEDTDH